MEWLTLFFWMSFVAAFIYLVIVVRGLTIE